MPRITVAGGEGEGAAVDYPFEGSYDPEATAPAEVYVDGLRIPVINDGITVKIRKASDAPQIRRVASVTFPATSHGVRWTEAVEEMDKVAVHFRDRWSEELEMVFRGRIESIGPHGSSENALQLQAAGPGSWMDRLPINHTFPASISSAKILAAFLDLFHEVQNQYETVTLDADYDTSSRSIHGRYQTGFNANRDTMADMLEWFRTGTDTYVFFEPDPAREDGVILRNLDDPHRHTRRASHAGGSIDVLHNDALSEIAPANAIVLQGNLHERFMGMNIPGSDVDGDYPYATAVAEPLVDRASGERFTQVDESYHTTVGGIENHAKQRLAEIITDTSSGQVITTPTTQLYPYDTLTTKPVTYSDIIDSVEPLEYEVDEITHRAEATDRGILAWSDIRVSLHVDLNNDLTIVDSGQRESSGGGGGGPIIPGPFTPVPPAELFS